jgi:hypothetical protein
MSMRRCIGPTWCHLKLAQRSAMATLPDCGPRWLGSAAATITPQAVPPSSQRSVGLTAIALHGLLLKKR